MARVLLIADPNGPDSGAIAATLRRRRHSVDIARTIYASPGQAANSNLPYDVVIVDLTEDHPSDWLRLHEVLAIFGPDQSPAGTVCYSKVYRGPRTKLRLESLGVRFVWL